MASDLFFVSDVCCMFCLRNCAGYRCPAFLGDGLLYNESTGRKESRGRCLMVPGQPSMEETEE